MFGSGTSDARERALNRQTKVYYSKVMTGVAVVLIFLGMLAAMIYLCQKIDKLEARCELQQLQQLPRHNNQPAEKSGGSNVSPGPNTSSGSETSRIEQLPPPGSTQPKEFFGRKWK